MQGLDGKVALVTGAATGLGEAVARRLASDGVKVVVAGHDGAALAALAAELGGLAVELDVRDEDALSEAVARCDDLGGLALAANAAGITGPAGVNTEALGADE